MPALALLGSTGTVLHLDDVVVDLGRLRVERDATVTSLTAMEARLVACLASAGRPVPERELLREVWGYAPGVRSRTVQITVNRLRRKIEADPLRPRHLVTVRGAGYRLATERPDRPELVPVPAGLAEVAEALVAALRSGPGAAARVVEALRPLIR